MAVPPTPPEHRRSPEGFSRVRAGHRLCDGPGHPDPDLFFLTASQITEWPRWRVDRLERSQGARIDLTRGKDDRQDYQAPGLFGLEDLGDFLLGDERRGEEVGTDQQEDNAGLV